MSGTEPAEVRTRIMAATIACAERQGVGGFSMEDVAREAAVSRTTIYRYFPEGRSQLLSETVYWEVGRFWSRLADAVVALPSLEDRLVAGLLIGRRMINKSRILTNLGDPDIGELLEAAQPTEPLVQEVIRSYMRAQLDEEKAAGRVRGSVDLEVAADYLSRMTLSWMGNSPGLDLSDDHNVRRFVRTQFLAGILVPAT